MRNLSFWTLTLTLTLLVTFMDVAAEETETEIPESGPFSPSAPGEPFYDPVIQRTVTTNVGETAHLNCKVWNFRNGTVFWLRPRDSYILTVGTFTYTPDQRFQTILKNTTDDAEDWTLRISNAQKRDEGIYNCQLATPIRKNFYVTLEVVGSAGTDGDE